MPSVSRDRIAEVRDYGVVEERTEEVDGTTISFMTVREDVDSSSLLRGLPGDRCTCPHFGYVFSGRLSFDFGDREETFHAGDAFVVPAGHTLVAMMLPEKFVDPIHKVTIIPRGQALGVTQQLPEEDRHNIDRRYAEARIAILMAGRIAEELALDGQQTTGAGNDIEVATNLARKMVCEWGMSDKLGPISYARNEGEPFLGRDIHRPQNYSEATARAIDQEIHDIIHTQYARAKDILQQHYAALERLASTLIEREALSSDEVAAVTSRTSER